MDENLVIFNFVTFSEVLKKEDTNNEEDVLTEIKIAGKEEPAGTNMTSDILEMSDLSPDSIPEKNQDEGDSDPDPETRKLEGEMF